MAERGGARRQPRGQLCPGPPAAGEAREAGAAGAGAAVQRRSPLRLQVSGLRGGQSPPVRGGKPRPAEPLDAPGHQLLHLSADHVPCLREAGRHRGPAFGLSGLRAVFSQADHGAAHGAEGVSRAAERFIPGPPGLGKSGRRAEAVQPGAVQKGAAGGYLRPGRGMGLRPRRHHRRGATHGNLLRPAAGHALLYLSDLL